MLRSADWYSVTDVSGRPISPVVKGQGWTVCLIHISASEIYLKFVIYNWICTECETVYKPCELFERPFCLIYLKMSLRCTSHWSNCLEFLQLICLNTVCTCRLNTVCTYRLIAVCTCKLNTVCTCRFNTENTSHTFRFHIYWIKSYCVLNFCGK